VATTLSGEPLSSFVGRSREVGELVDRVGGNRLVTITGPGGAGKTRLALTVADRLEATLGTVSLGEVWFVDLAHVGVDDVADAIAARVGDDRPGVTLADVAVVIGSRRDCSSSTTSSTCWLPGRTLPRCWPRAPGCGWS
jgi:predicted ATPase